MVDIALRAHNHNWRLDPVVRSLLDTDFYKLLMGQFIFNRYPDAQVTFALANRTHRVKLLGDGIINVEELREQLDHVRKLRFTNQELIWLQGNTFYGKQGIFTPGYIEFLRRLTLPPYEIESTSEGDLLLTFTGSWKETTYWEIHALAIVSELRSRHALRKLSKFELDILYSRAKAKLWDKLLRLAKLKNLNLSDMGTRRRHSFLWQEWAVSAAAEALKDGFSGTSNAYLAYKYGWDAKGTSGHELPMALTAIESHRKNATDEQIRQVQYEVCKHWQNDYSGNLLIVLPDAFGTTQFLDKAPPWLADWKGFRPDSKNPDLAAAELIAWWRRMGVNPKEKLVLFSDALDTDDIIALQGKWSESVLVGFGWGTMLTNDFKGLLEDKSLDPLSLVCKVGAAGGLPAVKLSDNYEKAMGPKREIERYLRIFSHEGMESVPVTV